MGAKERDAVGEVLRCVRRLREEMGYCCCAWISGRKGGEAPWQGRSRGAAACLALSMEQRREEGAPWLPADSARGEGGEAEGRRRRPGCLLSTHDGESAGRWRHGGEVLPACLSFAWGRRLRWWRRLLGKGKEIEIIDIYGRQLGSGLWSNWAFRWALDLG